MELVEIKGYEMPIHTLPPDSWEQTICKGLIPRILMLLSINLEKNPERIAATELMIRESANRITPSEIEKAFKMYVMGQLSNLEPRDNYLTPILFNKVVNQYKQQKNTAKVEAKVELSEEEKKQIEEDRKKNEYLNCLYAYDEWKQDGKVPMDYHWVVDTLKEKGLLKVSEEESKSLNTYLRENYPDSNREKRWKKGRSLILERFFERLKVPLKEILI